MTQYSDQTELSKQLEEVVFNYWIQKVLGERDPTTVGILEDLPGLGQTLLSFARTCEQQPPTNRTEELRSQIKIRRIFIGPCEFSHYNILCPRPEMKPDQMVPEGLAIAYVDIPNNFGLIRHCIEITARNLHGYFPCEGSWGYEQVITLEDMKIRRTRKVFHFPP